MGLANIIIHNQKSRFQCPRKSPTKNLDRKTLHEYISIGHLMLKNLSVSQETSNQEYRETILRHKLIEHSMLTNPRVPWKTPEVLFKEDFRKIILRNKPMKHLMLQNPTMFQENPDQEFRNFILVYKSIEHPMLMNPSASQKTLTRNLETLFFGHTSIERTMPRNPREFWEIYNQEPRQISRKIILGNQLME